MKKHVLCIILAAVAVSFMFFPTGVSAKETEVKKWTFMVFLNADNDLDEFGVTDLKEMEKAGLSGDVNVVVQIDRFKLPARRYFVSGRHPQSAADDWGLKSKNVAELGEVDMGDFKEMVKFVKWSAENYPAENYMLTVWNHGAGWKKRHSKGEFKGISYDDDSNNHMSTRDLGVGLISIHGVLGKPLDVFGMDACLMQMIEVAYELKDCAKFIVASEETEPGDGWPYDLILAPLYKNAGMSAYELAKMIPQAYFQSYYNAHDDPIDSPYATAAASRHKPQQRVKSTTLSAIDCSYIVPFTDALDAMCEMQIKAIPESRAELQAIASAVASAQKFYYYDNIDIGDLAIYMSMNTRNAEIKDAAARLKMAYKKLVVESKTTGDAKRDSTGLAIYFPMENFNETYSTLNFAKNSRWDELVKLVLASDPIFENDDDPVEDDKK